jgi:hypothetical protein
MKAMLTFVLRSTLGDCTANGLTSREDKILLTSEDGTITGPFETKDGVDYLVLKRRGDYMYAVPKSVIDEGVHSMFGGNFVHTSDSRFPNQYPIPVHDRVERYKN